MCKVDHDWMIYRILYPLSLGSVAWESLQIVLLHHLVALGMHRNDSLQFGVVVPSAERKRLRQVPRGGRGGALGARRARCQVGWRPLLLHGNKKAF